MEKKSKLVCLNFLERLILILFARASQNSKKKTNCQKQLLAKIISVFNIQFWTTENSNHSFDTRKLCASNPLYSALCCTVKSKYTTIEHKILDKIWASNGHITGNALLTPNERWLWQAHQLVIYIRNRIDKHAA